jgi:DNA-directed RNA polymerase specialized sigma24 family protein
LTEFERCDIGARLENWARWATAGTRTIGVSPTGAFCDRLRREALGDDPSHGERRTIDEHDALRIERAMPKLETKHRLLLYWCYIKQARPEMVCSRMGIPSRPATVFVALFRQAQEAIEEITLERKIE